MIDVVIIGGGPAGCSTAIRLAQIGMRVRLYEKTRFPREKLCGGFLSPECLPDLDELGVLPQLQSGGAFQVNRIVVTSPQGRRSEAAWPTAGLSVPRDRLDDLLLQRAREVGVDVHEGTDGFAHLDEAPWRVIAAGRRPCADRKNLFGVQATFENMPSVTDQVELDMIAHGYVGLVRVSPLRVNVCALVSPEILSQGGTHLEHLQNFFIQENCATKRHLSKARRLSAWRTVGPIHMGLRSLTQEKTFFVGDAAYVPDPFVGEGISMGLQSAALLQQAFHQIDQPIVQAYERAWHRRFDVPIRTSGWLRRIMPYPLIQETVIMGLRLRPAWLAHLTDLTRPSQYGIA